MDRFPDGESAKVKNLSMCFDRPEDLLRNSSRTGLTPGEKGARPILLRPGSERQQPRPEIIDFQRESVLCHAFFHFLIDKFLAEFGKCVVTDPKTGVDLADRTGPERPSRFGGKHLPGKSDDRFGRQS